MLIGHLDEVSHAGVEGWATDDTWPNEPVDVSIFIDQLKVAQLTCDNPREDLRETGQYGEGNHGFAYQFPVPLSESDDVRLSVRFSISGYPVTNGECLLSRDGVRRLPLPAPLPDEEPAMMPAPCTPRSLFELLYWYDEDLGLAPLLSRLVFDDLTPQHVHYGVFGEQSEVPVYPTTGRYYPRDHLSELLLSNKFQSELLPRLLRAYEDKRRLVFIHIPKCAGTDLSNKLKTKYPWIDFNIMNSEWTLKAAMLEHLSLLATQLRFADCLYLCGHAGLDYYRRNHLIRPTDQIFTIIREPSDVIMSQVNYVLTRFWHDAECGEMRPDTQEWLELIDIDSLPSRMSEDFIHHAGIKILENTDIVKPNSICYWLGGDNADAQAAMDGLISQGVEVTDTKRYRDWLAQRWQVHSQSRDNSSMKFLSAEMLPRQYQDYIKAISTEDMKVFSTVDRSLERKGKLSVTGYELAEGLL